jgi:hypothetical protein
MEVDVARVDAVEQPAAVRLPLVLTLGVCHVW